MEQNVSRRQREREQHRSEILDAALSLFAENGYDNVSVSQIAEKAEFGTGTLYNFFDSKEALFTELARTYISEGRKKLFQALDSGGTATDKLRAFITAKGDFVRDNVKFVRLYMHDLRNPALYALQKEVMQAIGDVVSGLEQVFRQGIEQGIFKQVDPRTLAVSFNGISSIFIFDSIHFSKQFDYLYKIDEIMELFLRGALLQ